MRAELRTAGQQVEVACALPWVARLLAEAGAGEFRPVSSDSPDVRILVERSHEPFHGRAWRTVTRGAWEQAGEVVLTDACSTGFDLAVRPEDAGLVVRARWRPGARNRLAQHLLSSRFHLLTRAVLLQYPLLWWAGVSGLAPLHAAAVTVRGEAMLLAGPGGVGKSTLLTAETSVGELATSDNLCVSDGELVLGLVEPLRSEHGNGRRMPHGRREQPLHGRTAWLRPSRVLVVALHDGPARATHVDGSTAARALTTGTYMAGELRRYWAFAATLAAGTGLGAAHPPVGRVAGLLSSRSRCQSVVLSKGASTRLSDLLGDVQPRVAERRHQEVVP